LSVQTLTLDPPPTLMQSEDGRGFALSSNKWQLIKMMVSDASTLPDTPAKMAKLLNIDIKDIAEYQKLIDCYKGINTTCAQWDSIWTQIKELADDIYQYAFRVIGSKENPGPYTQIFKIAALIRLRPNDPDTPDLKKDLQELVDDLTTQANNYSIKADKLYTTINTFSNSLKADVKTLTGDDGKSGLFKEYSEKFAKNGPKIKEDMKEIADLMSQIKDFNARYTRDCVVAGVAATVTPIAFIGGPLAIVTAAVAVGFALDAAAMKKKIDAANAKIAQENAEIKGILQAGAALTKARGSITQISLEIAFGLIQVNKIKGIWDAIGKDLGQIKQKTGTIPTEAKFSKPITQSLLLWKKVETEANIFRTTADTTEGPN